MIKHKPQSCTSFLLYHFYHKTFYSYPTSINSCKTTLLTTKSETSVANKPNFNGLKIQEHDIGETIELNAVAAKSEYSPDNKSENWSVLSIENGACLSPKQV